MSPRLLIFAPLLASAAQPATDQCSKPIAVPIVVAAAVPNSTFYSNGEPPQRFAHVPRTMLRVSFGDEAIDAMCHRPPCGMVFLGCSSGTTMALPDPFKMSDAEFARVVRHEIGHLNGWPATHGA